MLSFQVNPGPGCFAIYYLLLNILTISTSLTDPNPSISNSVANYICAQQNEFLESGQIQTPLTAKPENDDSACGWYLWTKCGESKSESCPSFVLETCQEIEAQSKGKKGKGISAKWDEDKCLNSTIKGLPNIEIISSASKYPSLVTIQQGERCKTKLCTGLILDENWVVVMQSGCMWLWLQPKHFDLIELVAGEMILYAEDGTEQRRNLVQYIPHPGLKPRENHYFKDNIGLVRVSTPFEFNENVQPINWTAIEAISSSIASSILTIVGWTQGQPRNEDDVVGRSLIESRLDYFPMDECYDKRMEGDEAPKETLICAGLCLLSGDEKTQPSRNVLFAQVDSNSPPVSIGLGPLKHRFVPPEHGIFVNLVSYFPWIQEQTQSQNQISESEPESESRIIRGEDAPPYKYKSLVNIEVLGSYACSGHICGGVILNEEWFVTAAHCIKSATPAFHKAYVGDHDISDSDENEQVLPVVKIIAHEDYDPLTGKNDIAVVKVSPPFKFNDKVQKVTLPNSSFDPTGTLTTAGWGLNVDIVTPHILQQVEISVVSVKDCQEYWKNDNSSKKVITETNVCAGNETHGICKGDSGGALYFIDQSGEQTLVGLTSLIGSACEQNEDWLYDPFGFRASTEPQDYFTPSVFTRVTSYLDWIRKNAEMEEN